MQKGGQSNQTLVISFNNEHSVIPHINGIRSETFIPRYD